MLFNAERNTEKRDGWVTKSRRRKKPTRPNAIIIKPRVKLSYADVFRKMRSASELKWGV